MTLSYETAMALLERHGQSHVLRFYETLNSRQRDDLLAQVAELDFDSIERMQAMLQDAVPMCGGTAEFVPAKVLSLSGEALHAARAAGETALRAGEVGVILVAGGQGSRLGFEGPKGAYPIGPISGATLFEIHARKVVALERKYGAGIPYYIMTSRTNDTPTRKFFAAHDNFGLNPERVRFFEQGVWPALFPDGKLILERPDRIFVNPDGHGGTLHALRVNGMLEDMRQQGIKTLFYFQVDNPLVDIADPAFIGCHLLRAAQVSVKVCAKRDAAEGLGVVVERGGRNAVIEYTDPALTDALRQAVDAEGRLEFRFGSVAIHVFSLDFLSQEAVNELPLHLAHKKVSYCDDAGHTVNPSQPNACKFEKFIFDAIPDAERSINLEFKRDDEFSPVKNAQGVDSPGTVQRDMMAKWARWLELCGVAVPRDPAGSLTVKIEIDPCYALDAEGLAQKLPRGFAARGDILLR